MDLRLCMSWHSYNVISARRDPGTIYFSFVTKYFAKAILCCWGFLALTLLCRRFSSQIDTIIFLSRTEFPGSSPTLCKIAESLLGPVIYSLSYWRRYLEALFEKEAIRYLEVMARHVHGLSTRDGYTLNNYSSCVAVLFAMGFAYRLLALLFMLFTNRGKQH